MPLLAASWLLGCTTSGPSASAASGAKPGAGAADVGGKATARSSTPARSGAAGAAGKPSAETAMAGQPAAVGGGPAALPVAAASGSTPLQPLTAAAVGSGSGAAGAPASEPGSAAAGSGGQPSAAGDQALEPASGTPACRPVAQGVTTVLEGELLSLRIRCATGAEVPASLSVVPLPAGAAYDPDTSSLSWTPSLSQAGGYPLDLRAAAGDVTALRLEVLERFGAADNVPVTDPASYQTEYGLPVLHLTTDPGLNADGYTPAGVVYRGHRYTGSEAKLRGATSLGYPKRSFTVKFTKTDKLNDASVAGGFNAKRKLTVISTFDDNSYLRQRLAFELWNRLSPSHVQVQTYSGVLFLNGEYHGLYTFVDHVDGYLMEDFGFNQNGNLFKARNHDANFRLVTSEPPSGAAKSTPHLGYTKEEGVPEDGQAGAYDDLDALVQWAASADDSTFVSQIDALLAREEYESWWILVSFIKADDSSGKNSYHYHDPAAAGGLWHVIPWDFNESFGQDFMTRRAGAEATQPEGLYLMNNGLFERMLREPKLGPQLRARYASVLTGVYARDRLLERFDQLVEEISVSAQRDEQKWQAAYRAYPAWSGRTDFTTFDEEVQYVRQWIAARHAYLSSLYPR